MIQDELSRSFVDSMREAQLMQNKLMLDLVELDGYRKWYRENKSLVPWWIPNGVARRILQAAYVAGREEGFDSERQTVKFKRPAPFVGNVEDGIATRKEGYYWCKVTERISDFGGPCCNDFVVCFWNGNKWDDFLLTIQIMHFLG